MPSPIGADDPAECVPDFLWSPTPLDGPGVQTRAPVVLSVGPGMRQTAITYLHLSVPLHRLADKGQFSGATGSPVEEDRRRRRIEIK
jgi:hypothetical protein